MNSVGMYAKYNILKKPKKWPNIYLYVYYVLLDKIIISTKKGHCLIKCIFEYQNFWKMSLKYKKTS